MDVKERKRCRETCGWKTGFIFCFARGENAAFFGVGWGRTHKMTYECFISKPKVSTRGVKGIKITVLHFMVFSVPTTYLQCNYSYAVSTCLAPGWDLCDCN